MATTFTALWARLPWPLADGPTTRTLQLLDSCIEPKSYASACMVKPYAGYFPYLPTGGVDMTRHFQLGLLLALLFPLARFLLDVAFFGPLGRRLIFSEKLRSAKKLPEKSRLRLVKFQESCWKLLAYGSLEAAGLAIIFSEGWAADTRNFWAGWPLVCHSAALKAFYCAELGFYAYGSGALLVWETKRKDFGVMLVHHVATLALIALSLEYNFLRVGIVIMALHDASDIAMEGAKLFRYCGHELGTSVMFVVFTLSWVVCRLLYLPGAVIRSVLTEASALVPQMAPCYGQARATWAAFVVLLLVLLALHCYWFFLIVKMLLRQVAQRGKVEKDIRSDDEADDD